MDLGISGKHALVCGASRGLGRACALQLAREGVHLVITARGRDALEATAGAIREETGVPVVAIAGDIATETGRSAALAACGPDGPDILVNNAGGPPPGDFRDWEREDWLRALDANMLAPIFLIRAVVDGMRTRRFGRIVNITSVAVKSPIPVLGLSNGARAGLTGFCAGLARQVARDNVTINALLPGPFLTDRVTATVRPMADESMADALAREAAGLPSGRFGTPEEFGQACAFLCGAGAGYIVGQNIVLDGGGFNATLG